MASAKEKQDEKELATEFLIDLATQLIGVIGYDKTSRLLLSLCEFSNETFFPEGELIIFFYLQELFNSGKVDPAEILVVFSNVVDCYTTIAESLTITERHLLTPKILSTALLQFQL
jgi:hypothetical protein